MSFQIQRTLTVWTYRIRGQISTLAEKIEQFLTADRQ